jgi:hypothetical protein
LTKPRLCILIAFVALAVLGGFLVFTLRVNDRSLDTTARETSPMPSNVLVQSSSDVTTSTVRALHDGVDAMPEVLSEPAAHQPSDKPTEEEEGAEDVPLTEEELRRSLQLPDERVTAVEVNSKSIAMAIRQYWQVYRHIPENPGSMVAALQGDNEEKLVFIEWEESNLSDEGFLDPWGRPYDVSIVSNVIVVISGGANRVIGDDDDVVKSVKVPRISPHEE